MENVKPSCFGTLEGSLPGQCASLVFPYVPMQCQGSERFEPKDGLAVGTLFPGLGLPFCREMQTRMGCDDAALCELMALSFAITELGLYLDTHKDDKEALELYRQYVAMAKDGRKRYEKANGPLRQTAAGSTGTWNWLDNPWPWENEGGRR